MIIHVKLFLPGRNPNETITKHLQQIVAESLITTKSDEFGDNDYCQVSIITDPLFLKQGETVMENKNNLIQVKKNGRNLFRNTTEFFRKESERFEEGLLKKISINIGNNLKILY